MNYLAHLALSGNGEEILVGNFIADSIKGKSIEQYPTDIIKGIRLHRFIDHYTDHHLEFINTKRIFSSEFDKYSGVLVDIFFDHFLACKFNEILGKDLQNFVNNCYSVLIRYFDLFPEKAKAFYSYMIKNNILFEYKNMEGIKKVLEGLYHKINFIVPIHRAYDVFVKHYEEVEKNFDSFFPELKNETEKFLINS